MRYQAWILWLVLFYPQTAYNQWEYVNPVATADNYVAMDFLDAATGFALTSHGTLMGTADGGNRWAKVESVSPHSGFFLDMVFTSSSEGTITSTRGLILHTRNGGHTWDSIPSGTNANLQSVFMYSNSIGYIVGLHGTVLKTVDGGLTWNPVQTIPGRDLYDCWFVDPETGFVAADKHVFKTRDGGNTWNQILLADSGDNFIRIAFADSLNGFTVGRRGAAFKTSDGGNNWIRTPTGTTRYLYGLSIVNPQVVYITGSNGLILKSKDNGETWNMQSSGIPYDLGSIVFTDENKGSASGPLGAILHTTDGGNTWKPATYATLNNLWDCSFPELEIGYACGSDGTILKTNDGGNSWSLLETGTAQTLYTIFMTSPLVGYSAGDGGTIIKTIDEGNTWNKLTSPEPVFWNNLFFSDANNGFLVGRTQVIYHTTDGGQTWDSYNTGTNAALNAIEFHGLSGYACGINATLLQTMNGGVSWQQIVVPELCEANLNVISCIDQDNCYVAGNQYIDNANICFLAFTHDGGNTWQVKTFAFFPSKIFTALFFRDAMTGYLGGSGFIWKTRDGGNHWIDQTTYMEQTNPNAFFFVTDEVGFSVSYGGQIMRTINGGGIGFKDPGMVNSSLLEQNYPNPFSSKTRITYHLPVKSKVELVIVDVTGRKVITLINQDQSAGTYFYDFDGTGLPSGFYFYRLLSKGGIETGKMVKN
ncbi:MAG: YCF48-related protein [Bacteroidales bacterium]|jgi:photosystem II stability/assembly factor-like uncharacterized protein|nr:YCF48-related protein [Bacteroidales bacterium]